MAQKATLLIIDDDPITLGLLRTRLGKAGYVVKEAKDGSEGIDMAEKARPDLIILDVRMPKVDGWQVCQTLKSNPITRLCPIMILTGCSQDVQELYGLQCGADAYITKPWDARQLLDTISKLLTQSTASQDVRSEAAQQRAREYIQRVVRVVGSLPKAPHVEGMAAQILTLATSFIAAYQTAVTNGAMEMLSKLPLADQRAEELIYWLGLLRDSNASDNSDIPQLLAEGTVLRQIFAATLKKASRK